MPTYNLKKKKANSQEQKLNCYKYVKFEYWLLI